MKQSTTNTWNDGLNLDLHPIVTPNTVLTDNLNGTFITYNGNEFCLQNDKGNTYKCSISNGFIPIGAKEHNGVIYIASVNEEGEGELGFYPGIKDWTAKEDGLDYNLYTPLHNLITSSIKETYRLNLTKWNGDHRNDIITLLGLYGVDEQTAENSLVKGKDAEFIIYENNFSKESCVYQIREYNAFDNVELVTLSEKNIDNSDVFRTKCLNFDLEHPVTIDVQDSYDGSVNLILTDDKNPPRIINTGFSVNEKKYKIIERNQDVDINIYNDGDVLKEQINLVRITNTITNISLENIKSGGQLKGGNYKFYVKFGDADYNQSDIVAESGIVSIFNGTDSKPDTVTGTLEDERTNKMVCLKIKGINKAFSKIYIYYSREYSDTNGFRMSEAGMLTEPFDISKNGKIEDPIKIWITGFEQTTSISIEDLNIDYHTIDFAKTIAQQQDMLFLGNVGQEETFDLYQELREFTKNVITTIKQDTQLTPVTCDYKSGDEYYSAKNIHDKLGYWPDEIYRFGVVYILKDGSTTPVFNMYGGNFDSIDDIITKDSSEENHNEYGVFKTPNVGIISKEAICPISFNFKLPEIKENSEISEKVLGWFIVRQKRIPRTICQGLSIGIDKESHLPMIWNGKNWIIESFLSINRGSFYLTNEDLIEAASIALEAQQHALSECSNWNFLNLAVPFAGTIAELICKDSSGVYNIDEYLNTLKTSKKIPLLLYNYDDRNKLKSCPIYGFRPDYNAEYRLDYDNYAEYERLIKQTIGFIENENIKYIFDVEDTSEKISLNGYVFELYNTKNEPLHIVVIYITNRYKAIPQYLTLNYQNQSYSVPMYVKNRPTYTLESSQKDRLIHEKTEFINGYGLLSLDPCINNIVSGQLDGSEFELRREYNVKTCFGISPETLSGDIDEGYNGETLRIDQNDYTFIEDSNKISSKCVYIGPETRSKVVDDFIFSNIAGNASSINDYASVTNKVNLKVSIGTPKTDPVPNGSLVIDNKQYHLLYDETNRDDDTFNINIVRGIFTPYIGLTSNDITAEGIYSIRHKEPDLSLLFKIREQDNSPYYCVTKRNYINKSEQENIIDVFGGDCYTNTVTMRILRNFIDPNVPHIDRIVDPYGWNNMLIHIGNDYNTGKSLIEAQENVNSADLNAVDLGYWVTYKCLSSYNLGLRSENSFNVNELATLGSPRSFYPISGLSTANGNKVEESYLLNDGLSATVGEKRYNLLGNIPYTKNEFDTRVMFSNKQVSGAFTNGYRTIQGLSYQDYDKQYGAITKLLPWGNNLFCVFEHGIAILPVNEKALMQTTTEQTIHIYGHGVLPEQMSIVSQDYGSKYADSVVRTPLGIYGIDVDAKKIWRFTDKQGFETISDMKIESFLNQNLNWKSLANIKINESDVRTHYNSFKGDVIFTWYYIDHEGNKQDFSICFNERQSLWTTRYDWIPIISENANGEFYSLQYGDNSNGKVGIYHHNPIDSSPTKWYGKQHVFEFEFVVSDPIGVHKIFEDLQIISNNVQPEELSFEIIGDAYMFNKSRIYHTVYDGNFRDKRMWSNETTNKLYKNISINKDTTSFAKPELLTREKYHDYHPFRNGSLLNDRNGQPVYGEIIKTPNATEQYHLRIPQECRNIETWGRRLGNIHYKNDSWYTNIEPILYDARLNDPNITELSNPVTKWNSTRIRDKWCKIRVRYSGEDLSIITAIKTALNI